MNAHRALPLLSAIACALVLLPAAASAQSGTGTATAEVLATIQVTSVADLDFGQIVPKQVPGTVTVSSSGSVTSSDVFVITSGTPAQWNVTGIAGEAYSITLPTTVTLLFGGTSGANTMVVNNFEHNAGASPSLDGTGNDSFNVGATLNVGANQAPGVYSRPYSVSVAYN